MTTKHKWEKGDLYIHKGQLYILYEINGTLKSFVFSREMRPAASEWREWHGATFIKNIVKDLEKLRRDIHSRIEDEPPF